MEGLGRVGATTFRTLSGLVFGIGIFFTFVTIFFLLFLLVLAALVVLGRTGVMWFGGFGMETPQGSFWLVGPWLLVTAALGRYYFFPRRFGALWVTVAVLGMLYVVLASWMYGSPLQVTD